MWEKGNLGPPPDKPVPNHSWLVSKHVSTPSISQGAQARCSLLACLLVTPRMDTFPTYRCWPDTGQAARTALLCGC